METNAKRRNGVNCLHEINSIPEWTNSTGIANLIGKTTRRVQQLTAEGVLQTEVPPAGGKRKYHTCRTVRQYIAHIQAQVDDESGEGKMAELTLKKLEAEIALKESQGQMHQLKTAIQEGKYLPAEQATEELLDFLTTFQKFALAIPARMANIMSSYTDSHAVRNMEHELRSEIESMFTTFVKAAQERADTS